MDYQRTAASAALEITPPNRRDSDYIRWIQRALNRILGLRLAEDGMVGRQTRSAIRSFQQRYGLQADGNVGARTEQALVRAGAGAPPPGRARGAPGTPELVKAPSPPSDTYEAGVKTAKTASFEPDLGNPRDIVLAAVAAAEGGYDTVNMYDRGILSWGIMQWTVHAGSLQGALAYIKSRLEQDGQSTLWSQLFPGLDIQRIGGEDRLIHRGTPLIEQSQLRQVFRGSTRRGEYDETTIKGWASVFALAGRHPVIQALQRDYARTRVDSVMGLQLGSILSAFKSRQCRRPPSSGVWQFVCGQLTEPAEFYRSNYGPLYIYLGVDPRSPTYGGGDLKAAVLFFGMWTQNPAGAYVHLKKVVDQAAGRYGTYDTARWPSGWRSELSASFERILRASQFASWGDAKATILGRTSRTQKILDEFSRLTRRRRSP